MEKKQLAKAEGKLTEASSPSSEAGLDLVEGGWAGWATLLGAFLVQFFTGFATSFGVYQDFYARVYLTNMSPSTIAWIGSVNGCLSSVGGLLAGRLYDRGYFYHLMIGGTLLSSLSLFLLSFVQPNCFYQIFLTQGVGLGIASGAMYVPAFAVLSHHFHRYRIFAMSFVACGASMGAILNPIMLNNTLNGKLGFANATRLLASIVTFLLGLSCFLMRTRPLSVKPMELGPCIKKFCRDGAYIAALFGAFFYFLGYNYPLFFLQLDAMKHGISKDFAFYVFVFLSVSSCIGRLITSLLVRKIGLEILATLSPGCCAIVIFGMIGLKAIPDVVAIAIFYGFFSGMYMCLNAPFFALLADNTAEIGLRMGIGLTFSGIGILIGSPIHGAALTEAYIWWRPAVFSGLACLIGCFLSLLATIILHRRRKNAQPKDEPESNPSSMGELRAGE